MNDLDRKIQEALRGTEGVETLAREPNLAEELIDTFCGRYRWLNGLAFIFTFAFCAVAFWAGFKFYGAETPHDQQQWGGLCLLGMLGLAFIKVYFWMVMHTNHVLRELKRVELLFLQRERTRTDGSQSATMSASRPRPP